MPDWFETMEKHLWLLPVHRIQIRNEKGEEEARFSKKAVRRKKPTMTLGSEMQEGFQINFHNGE